MKKAVYPGSFDPITNGHIDLIYRALKIFDELIIAILVNPKKKPLFSLKEREEMIKKVFSSEERIKVKRFSGLLVDFLKDENATVAIRGLRAVSDFELEFQMALTNRKLYPEFETFFMVPGINYTFLNSTVVKEIYRFGGRAPELIPAIVEEYLIKKFKDKNELG